MTPCRVSADWQVRTSDQVGYILELMKVSYIAIDTDASLVARERSEGKSVYFGDAQRPEVPRAAGAADAPFVIVTIDDIEATESVVSFLHSAFPDIHALPVDLTLVRVMILGPLVRTT